MAVYNHSFSTAVDHKTRGPVGSRCDSAVYMLAPKFGSHQGLPRALSQLPYVCTCTVFGFAVIGRVLRQRLYIYIYIFIYKHLGKHGRPSDVMEFVQFVLCTVVVIFVFCVFRRRA